MWSVLPLGAPGKGDKETPDEGMSIGSCRMVIRGRISLSLEMCGGVILCY